jgi:L-amino acid N-acyltransferase YncA
VSTTEVGTEKPEGAETVAAVRFDEGGVDSMRPLLVVEEDGGGGRFILFVGSWLERAVADGTVAVGGLL